MHNILTATARLQKYLSKTNQSIILLLHPHQKQIADSENKDNNDIHKNMVHYVRIDINHMII